MSLASLFETALQELQSQRLPDLVIALCEASLEQDLSDTGEEQKLIGIVEYLLGIADWSARKEIADRVITMSGLSSQIYLCFACDRFSIAEPFLMPDFYLSVEDCLHIARNTTKEHRVALTRRAELPSVVVQELMRSGEIEVVRALNENQEDAVIFEYDDTIDPEAVPGEGDDDGENSDAAQEINALDLMVSNFAAKSRYSDLIETLSKNAHLPKAIVKELFSKPEAEPFSILCKGLGVGDDAFSVVAQFRSRRLGQLARLGEQAAEDYRSLDSEYALAMLKELQAQNSWLPNVAGMAGD